jgi:hypothetical protein
MNSGFTCGRGVVAVAGEDVVALTNAVTASRTRARVRA